MFRHMPEGYSLRIVRPGSTLDHVRSRHILRASCMYLMQNACIVSVTVPKAIQIRDVPDDVHARLRARASASGMSMSEYLRSELIRLAGQETMDEVYKRILTRHGGVSREEIVATIREMRGGPLPP